MKRIDLSETWYDHEGIAHTKADIEKWYLENVKLGKNGIEYKLRHLRKLSADEKEIRDDLVVDLDRILIGDPVALDGFRTSYGDRLNHLPVTVSKKKAGRKPKTFRQKLLYAFGYNNARHGVLVELAMYLNVKTCPYCNLHYTLSIRDFNSQKKKVLMAKMQFDHFFDKATYPFLSMSLYNLIPSCPICNQGKSQRLLTLDFHPYHADICSTFKFEVKNPLQLYIGSMRDEVELELVEQSGVSIVDYNQAFHITKLYERHMDVAQEEFAKAYVNYYYGNPSNFDFIADRGLRERLNYGYYHDEKDINKRPMSKFKQDLWKQAVRDIRMIKMSLGV